MLWTPCAPSQCYWLWSHGGEVDAACEVLKLCSLFFTLWLIFFLHLYYRRKFEQLKSTNALLPQDSFVSSGLLLSMRDWSFLPEALLFLIHAPPFVSFEVSMPYYDLHRSGTYTTTLSTDELATLFMMFSRALLLIRWIPYVAGLANNSTRMYANLQHLELSTSLSIRVTLLRMPLKILSCATLLLLAMLGFALQTTERRVNHDLDHFSNGVWLALVSMTGIGYGDFYPQTILGRLFAMGAFSWGATLAALGVQYVLRTTELTQSESRLKAMIERTSAKSRLQQRAARYIQAAWASYLERLQRSQSAAASASLMGHEPLHTDPKFCRSMRHFRVLRKSLSKPDDIAQLTFKEVLDTRSRVELRLRDLEEKLEEMDAKFEHNIAAMNELLQKNLKYLKHLA